MKRALVQTIETEQLKPLICPSRNMQTHNLVPSYAKSCFIVGETISQPRTQGFISAHRHAPDNLADIIGAFDVQSFHYSFFPGFKQLIFAFCNIYSRTFSRVMTQILKRSVLHMLSLTSKSL